MQSITVIGYVLVALTLLISGIVKLANPRATDLSLMAAGVAPAWTPALATSLSVIDLAAAVALLLPTLTVAACAAYLAALASISLLVIQTLARVSPPDVYGLGEGGARSVLRRSLVRNGFLGAFAVAAIAGAGAYAAVWRQLGWAAPPALQAGLTALAASAVLTFGVAMRRHSPPPLPEPDALGPALDRGPVPAARERRAAVSRDRTLLMSEPDLRGYGVYIEGDRPPPIRGFDQWGSPRTLSDFAGRALVLLFWRADCLHSQRLVELLLAWEAAPPPSAPRLLVLTSSPRSLTRNLGLRSPVLSDFSESLAHSMRCAASPTAILLSPQGRIACPPAPGGDGVLALLHGYIQPPGEPFPPLSMLPEDSGPAAARADEQHREPADDDVRPMGGAIPSLVHGVRRAIAETPLRGRGKRNHSVRALNDLAESVALHEASNTESAAARLTDLFYWPVEALRQLRTVDPSVFRDAARLRRRPTFVHAFGTWNTCRRLGLSATEFHNFGLFGPARARDANQFISKKTVQRLFVPLLAQTTREERILMSDKARFADYCRRNGIPAIPVLAIAQQGAIEHLVAEVDPAWAGELIVKPRFGTNGIGLSRWARNGGEVIDEYGAVVSLNDALEVLASRSPSRPMIVQPRATNTRELAPFTNGALATTRIVTGMVEGSEPTVIAAALKMPVGDAQVDNFGQGNVLSQIDASTGLLKPGRLYLRRVQPIERHPDTGALFAGAAMPQWAEMKALVLGVHRRFPNFAVLAFDVAASPDGPLLVELNNRGDLNLIQYPEGPPLGLTAFPEVVLSRLSGDRPATPPRSPSPADMG